MKDYFELNTVKKYIVRNKKKTFIVIACLLILLAILVINKDKLKILTLKTTDLGSMKISELYLYECRSLGYRTFLTSMQCSLNEENAKQWYSLVGRDFSIKCNENGDVLPVPLSNFSLDGENITTKNDLIKVLGENYYKCKDKSINPKGYEYYDMIYIDKENDIVMVFKIADKDINIERVKKGDICRVYYKYCNTLRDFAFDSKWYE